jgi:hypothetical protein
MGILDRKAARAWNSARILQEILVRDELIHEVMREEIDRIEQTGEWMQFDGSDPMDDGEQQVLALRTEIDYLTSLL